MASHPRLGRRPEALGSRDAGPPPISKCFTDHSLYLAFMTHGATCLAQADKLHTRRPRAVNTQEPVAVADLLNRHPHFVHHAAEQICGRLAGVPEMASPFEEVLP